MIKFWVKTVVDEKLLDSKIVEIEGVFKEKCLGEYLVQICYQLDIPTPIVLKSHAKHLASFNNVKFSSTDFIDYVPFHTLQIELVTD